jgi:hypothetical protein
VWQGIVDSKVQEELYISSREIHLQGMFRSKMMALKELQIRLKKIDRPLCPECKKMCVISKIGNKWLCKNCNNFIEVKRDVADNAEK